MKEKMMLIPQKVQYGLRALFELGKNTGNSPFKIADIAKAQAIPIKFLEIILSQLKQGGFVESKRGAEGGYYLLRLPEDISIGEIIEFLQGAIAPVACLNNGSKQICSLYGGCVFLSFWDEVRHAISNVCDNTTIKDLIERETRMSEVREIMYYI
jgi:Rrf2 family transcriptional regulator, cysteine metabolism repressor